MDDKFKCPHCGWVYDPEKHKFRFGAVPTHDFQKLCRSVCPGSSQAPRNAETDKRPLWKDETN